MSTNGRFVTTEEAARLLGVTVQHLRRLADSGAVTRLARGVIDRNSIDRYLVANPTSRTRAWAEHTAWGAIAMLAGTHPDWLGPGQASRLRSDLRQISDPADLIARTRDRAVVRTYTGHRSAVGMLAERLVIPDAAILGLTQTAGEFVDGYLTVDAFQDTIDSFHLREDPNGSVTLRVTGFPIDIVEDLAAEVTLTALDAATSLDPRTRGLGERALSATLNAFRQ